MSDPSFYRIPFWLSADDPLIWDRLWLGGEEFPGLTTISGQGLQRKIDVKDAKGEDGGSIRDEGYQPARIQISIQIYSESDWQWLQELWPMITPRKKGGVRNPLEILHPVTELLGIRHIYIDTIPVPKLADQILTVTFGAIEWIPEPKTVKKGAGTGGKNSDDIVLNAIKAFQSAVDQGNPALVTSFMDSPSEQSKKGFETPGQTQEDSFEDKGWG